MIVYMCMWLYMHIKHLFSTLWVISCIHACIDASVEARVQTYFCPIQLSISCPLRVGPGRSAGKTRRRGKSLLIWILRKIKNFFSELIPMVDCFPEMAVLRKPAGNHDNWRQKLRGFPVDFPATNLMIVVIHDHAGCRCWEWNDSQCRMVRLSNQERFPAKMVSGYQLSDPQTVATLFLLSWTYEVDLLGLLEDSTCCGGSSHQQLLGTS